VHGHPGHLLQEDAGSWLLGVQKAQDKVQRGCASGGQKEQRTERRRVGRAATTDNNSGSIGVAEEVGGSVGEGSGGTGSDGGSLPEDG